MNIRLPYRAGSFYAGLEGTLRQQIEGCFRHSLGPGEIPKIKEREDRKILSLISPHAGYIYSGPIAAKGYYNIAIDGKPDSIIIVGPNHTGYGSAVSIMAEGVWRTPLGDIKIDSELAKDIQSYSEFIDLDEKGHLYEHSIEVQLPFLQYIYGSFQFVPICMMMQDLKISRDIGKSIAKAMSKKDILLISSTDFSHNEPQNVAEAKDRIALKAILQLDEATLQSVVEDHGISMCGYGPVSVSIVASKELGATKVTLYQYKTSGDITGDKAQVVGYASLGISK